LVDDAVRRSHPEHAPARGPGEREEEEEHAARAEEGVADVAFQVAVDLEVAENECLRVGAAFERGHGAVAHAAVGAVAPDDVASMQALRPSVPVPQRARDTFVAGLELNELDAALDADAALGQVLVENP
jgi:hypothetical protein